MPNTDFLEETLQLPNPNVSCYYAMLTSPLPEQEHVPAP